MNTEKTFKLTDQEVIAIDGGYYPPEKKGSEHPWEIDWEDILICW